METKHEAKIANDLLKRHSSYFILCRKGVRNVLFTFLKHFNFLSGRKSMMLVSPDLLEIVG